GVSRARRGRCPRAWGGGTVGVPPPPAASGGPTVAGSARRGTDLVASPGTWANAPTGYSYQWQRLEGLQWDDIDGATSQRYRAASADTGHRLRVMVVATNADGSANAASAPTAPVGATGVNRA